MVNFSVEALGLAVGLGIVVLLLAISAAYRQGRLIAGCLRRDEFDRLATRLQLHGTSWTVGTIDAAESDAGMLSGNVRFLQYESRVVGAGLCATGGRWSAEGVVSHDRLCLTVVAGSGRQSRVETFLLGLCGSTGRLQGVRCIQPPGANAVRVQPLELVPDVDAGDENTGPAAEPGVLVTFDDTRCVPAAPHAAVRDAMDASTDAE